jgi:hypothetical protein
MARVAAQVQREQERAEALGAARRGTARRSGKAARRARRQSGGGAARQVRHVRPKQRHTAAVAKRARGERNVRVVWCQILASSASKMTLRLFAARRAASRR